MCVSFWLLDKHPAFWIVLALNRDEFYARPTLPLHFWHEKQDSKIVGGRDVSGGGTWLGITKTGRLAFLTNVREAKVVANFGNERTDVISRGALPTRFLESEMSPLEYLEEIALEADKYNGFNLVVADAVRGEMAYLTNRPENTKPVVRKLCPGIHALSNGGIDSKWPKMERGKLELESILSRSSSAGDEHLQSELIIERILADRTKGDTAVQVAETGCSHEFEQHLSSIFVETQLFGNFYGTRCMSVVGIRRNGAVSVFERSLEKGVWDDTTVEFQIEKTA